MFDQASRSPEEQIHELAACSARPSPFDQLSLRFAAGEIDAAQLDAALADLAGEKVSVPAAQVTAARAGVANERLALARDDRRLTLETLSALLGDADVRVRVAVCERSDFTEDPDCIAAAALAGPHERAALCRSLPPEAPLVDHLATQALAAVRRGDDGERATIEALATRPEHEHHQIVARAIAVSARRMNRAGAALAVNPDAGPQLAQLFARADLRRAPWREWALAALDNPRLPDSVSERFALDGAPALREALAGRARLSAVARAALCTDPRVSVRAVMAGRADLSAAEQAHCAADTSEVVRETLHRRFPDAAPGARMPRPEASYASAATAWATARPAHGSEFSLGTAPLAA